MQEVEEELEWIHEERAETAEWQQYVIILLSLCRSKSIDHVAREVMERSRCCSPPLEPSLCTCMPIVVAAHAYPPICVRTNSVQARAAAQLAWDE